MGDEALLYDLKKALNLIMSPRASQNTRNEAQKFVEAFKETASNSSQIGIQLAHRDNDQISRHFGLQLLEYCIKFRWNDLTITEKQFIKENTLDLIRFGTLDLLHEQRHVKDALSRVVVEIAKREWPQQWVQMISEFNDLSALGPIQEELVLLVLLRLAEDVLAFHAVPPLRRKDLMQAFTAIISQLLAYFNNILNKYFQQFIGSKDGSTEEAKIACSTAIKLIKTTLEATTAFMDLLSIQLLTPSLLPLLLTILSHPPLQLSAADCLLEIAAKKGKTEERRLLLDAFLCKDSLNKLHSVAVVSSSCLGNEESFKFFKKLCQVIVIITTQLCSLLAGHPLTPFVDTFDTLVNIILSFTTHPSQLVSGYCMPLWTAMFRCPAIAEQSVITQCQSSLILASINILAKVGQPSQNTHQSCLYSKFDFDNDEDFLHYLAKYRAEFGEVLRTCSRHLPGQAFLHASKQLTHLLSIPHDGASVMASEGVDATPPCPLHVEWEVVVVLFEFTFGRLDFMTVDEEIVQSAISLYKNVLDFQTSDPIICSNLLSIISVFFPLLAKDDSLFSMVVDKLFSYINFNMMRQSKCKRSRVVLNVRRHACSIFIKLSKMYPLILLPGFDYLRCQIEAMSNAPEGLSQMEKTGCYEALILIHNMVNDYEEQARFIDELLQPVREYWLSEQITRTLWSVDAFMDLVGLSKPPVEPSSDDVCGINRSQLQFCLTMILAVIKRSTFRPDGGENTTVRSPASRAVLPLLHNVFGIMRCYHEIFSPSNFSKVHPHFIPAFTLSDADKAMLIGVSTKTHDPSKMAEPTAGGKAPVDRMNAFSNNLTEMGYSIMGQACKYMDEGFYSMPQLPHLILNNLFCNVFILPHLKIKLNLHCFYRQFILHCPKEKYQSVLLPVFQAISPFFYQFLSSKWQAISSRYGGASNAADEAGNGEDTQGQYEHQETQEMVEDQMVIMITKEYLDCIENILKDKKCQSSSVTNVDMLDEAMEETEAPPTTTPTNHKKKEESLGELGQLVMAEDDLYPSIAWLLYISLSWPDTNICVKAVEWCYPVLKYLVSLEKVTATTANELYHTQLIGLNTHGQHDSVLYRIINSLLQSYELLAPTFPNIKGLLLAIPGCTEENLNAFDGKFVNGNGQMKTFEKRKREYFKSLIEGAIGHNIGQRFKNIVYIKNLQPFKTFRDKQKDLLSQNEENDFGLCSLFNPE